MKNQTGNATIAIIMIILVVAGAIGWVLNVIKLIGADFDPLTGIVVLRCIGVLLAPLGAILGYVG